jgi:hypothetical protein
MVRVEVRTGFEWMDTSFLITRILATFWGVLMAFVLFCATVSAVDDLHRRIFPPPPRTASADEEGEIVTRTNCFSVDRTPYRDLTIAFWLSVLPIAGMVLVWKKPRLGFLLSAGSWLTIGVLPWFERGIPDWPLVALVLLPPPWLCFAAWRVRPAPPPSPDLIIPIEDPETGFEWMDAVLEWLMAPFRLARDRGDGDPSL